MYGIFDHPALDSEDGGDQILPHEIPRQARFNDPALLHEDQKIGVAGCEVEVVQDEHDGAPALAVQTADKVQAVDLVGHP